jgi:hypothetical protein
VTLDARTIIVLVVIIGFVLGLNLMLFGALRGSRGVREEADKWGQAFGGGQKASAKHEADLAALRSAVDGLQNPPPPDEPPPHD